MDKLIRLRLYGEIDHSDADGHLAWQIYQSRALARLRDVSLSSTPSRFAPHGMAASRFEHSVGVGYLARRLADSRQALKEHKQLLLAAALCHDIGSPPFSHIAELFFWDLCGRTHEEETARLLQPGSELDSILKQFSVSAKEVIQIINGKHELLGPLIAGSIDLDNIDNSLHLLVSLGYDEYQPYHPLRLIKAFKFLDDQLHLDAAYLAEILGWQEGRRLLYTVLHSEPNLSSAAMLYRALEYAYNNDYIETDFFRMSESEAMSFLQHECGRETKRLIDHALRWQHYPLLYQSITSREDARLGSLYDDWRLKKDFTDTIAKDLGIQSSDIALYVGVDRGEKAIDLPFMGPQAAKVAGLFDKAPGPQRLSLFAHSDHLRLRESKKVENVLKKRISDLPETTDPNKHVFF